MKSKYKIIIIVSALLIFLSISISSINYFVTLSNTQKQLRTQSLPLSLDNIYTEIQKYIVEPYLLSSMMANDTFVHDWLRDDEVDKTKIKKYLKSINDKYGMFSTFLVADKSKNYYTQNGLIETIDINNDKNRWYYDFKKSMVKHEINIDINDKLSNLVVMFINYKIFDAKNKLIGVTGVALKISYIDKMLKNFREKYGFKVSFFNKKGEIVLSENKQDNYMNIKDKIISKTLNSITFKDIDGEYIINTKYIPELNLYLTVEARLDNYMQNAKSIFFFNLLISLIVTFIIVSIFYHLINRYNQKLELMAFNDPLTELYNRRYFEAELSQIIKIYNRKNEDFCIVFLDIDNFKNINDNFGHDIGDIVLKKIANNITKNLRETDIIARWGGEEVVILLPDTTANKAKQIAEKLRDAIETDIELVKLVSHSITASFGVAQFTKEDTSDSVIMRADKAMYLSKTNGKNRVTVL